MEQCGKSIFCDDNKHECNINRIEYFRSQIKKDAKFLILNDNRYIKKSNPLYKKQKTCLRSEEIQYLEYDDKKTR